MTTLIAPGWGSSGSGMIAEGLLVIANLSVAEVGGLMRASREKHQLAG
ncbi:hypothetical protein ACTMTI_05505 [Nonomuraea sp. H19]